jgi:DNA-binding NarL/FixJ family response regulator
MTDSNEAVQADAAARVVLLESDERNRVRLSAVIAADRRLLLADCRADWESTLQRFALTRPDIVLAGVAGEEPRAAAWIGRAVQAVPTLRVVVAIGDGGEPAALQWLAAGASGCIRRNCAGGELASRLLAALRGDGPIDSAVGRLLLERLRQAPRLANSGPTERVAISEREADVLRLLARGCTYAEAGAELGITLNTIASHVKSAYRKLDVHSAGAAVLRAVQLRLIEA